MERNPAEQRGSRPLTPGQVGFCGEAARSLHSHGRRTQNPPMSLSNKQLLALLGLKDGDAGATLGQRPSGRLRMIGQSGGPQPPAPPDSDRRGAPRFAPGETGWSGEAVLRPGTAVRIIDIACSGALIESPVRLYIDARMDLHLRADDRTRLVASGRVTRCAVASLSPMRFHAGIAFDAELDVTLEIDDKTEVTLVASRSRPVS